MKRFLVLLAATALGLVGLTAPAADAATGDVFTTWSVSLSTFYPTVRDGYRDSVDVDWDLNDYYDTTHVTVQVTNASGAVLRSQHFDYGLDYAWSWNGRTTAGAMAPVGDYTVTLIGTREATTDYSGNPVAAVTETLSAPVHLRTGYQTSRVTKTKSGNQGSATHSSSCYVDRDSYDETLGLDCWWGRYAQANFGFALPSNAYNLSWRIAGHEGNCCSDGRITKWGKRVSKTSFQAHVRVTNAREYIVESVRVTYTYRHRI